MSKKRWFIGLVGLLVVTLAVSRGSPAQGPCGGGVAPNGTLFHDEDGDGVCDYCGNTPRTRGGWGMMGGGMMRGGWGDRFGLVDVVARSPETERAGDRGAPDGQTSPSTWP